MPHGRIRLLGSLILLIDQIASKEKRQPKDRPPFFIGGFSKIRSDLRLLLRDKDPSLVTFRLTSYLPCVKKSSIGLIIAGPTAKQGVFCVREDHR